VRTFLFTLKAGMEYGTINETYDNMLRPQEDHVYHCFDYIRQGLMCNADLTVEWPREEENGERVAVDGWGVEHQCKDWVSWSLSLLEISESKCCLLMLTIGLKNRTPCWISWANTKSPMRGVKAVVALENNSSKNEALKQEK
jgi:hypothetical protein